MSGQERWRAFDASPVSHSVAHHLMAIAHLRDAHGYARVTDVAERLGLTRGSVSLTLKALESRGLIEKDKRRFLLLTGEGRGVVDAIRTKQQIASRFFSEVLGVPAEIAATDACKVEHLLSSETATAMLRWLRGWAALDEKPDLLASNESCAGQLEHCSSCANRCMEALLPPD